MTCIEDVRDWVKEGLVHAWFWETSTTPRLQPNNNVSFVGSCVGHGGYPTVACMTIRAPAT